MVYDKRHDTSYKVIDMHAHLGVWYNMRQVEITDQKMAKTLELTGIDSIFLSHLWPLAGEMKRGNDIAARSLASFSEARAFIAVNPHYPQQAQKELERYGKDGFWGIKLHPETHRYRVEKENCGFLFELANKKRCPVLIHVMDLVGIADCVEMAKAYPDVPVMMGHAGGIALRTQAVESALDVPNVYYDVTSSSMLEGCLEWMVKKAGSKRILFGTDIPFLDVKHCIGQVLYADLSADEKSDIFSGNAQRILDGIIA